MTVQDLVSCAEAYRASRTEADLISDEEEAAAVTIAYARNSKPGVTFKQWTKTAAEPEASKGAEDGRAPCAAMHKSKFRGYRQRVQRTAPENAVSAVVKKATLLETATPKVLVITSAKQS